MGHFANPWQWLIGSVMILSSLGVLFAPRPVHASLCFLLTLLSLATYYLQLSANFIAVMQVLVYAGAIMVTFMFVIVLFQDAHYQIEKFPSESSSTLLYAAGLAVVLALLAFGIQLLKMPSAKAQLPAEFGDVEGLGKVLYLDFFFPFEAVIFLFLVALIGAFYIGRKEN